MGIIAQNLVDKNNQLEKDLRIQILQNELVEEQFIELRKISRLLQDRMRSMHEDSQSASIGRRRSNENSGERLVAGGELEEEVNMLINQVSSWSEH